MAISYVGGVQGGRAGSTSTTTQSLSGTLSGGSDTSPSEGDLVVVLCAAGADTTAAPSQDISGNNNGAYTGLTAQSQLGGTYDSYHRVSYIIQGSTVDTSITIPSSGSARNAQRWIVHVFRGVDSTTPMDVTATYATGTATGRPNPAAITPVTAGAWIAAFYTSSAATGAAYTAPTDFATDWLGGTTADTADCMTGGGYYTGWTSGSYDPAAITAGGTTGANDSWTATTIALRPAPPDPLSVNTSESATVIENTSQAQYIDSLSFTFSASISGGTGSQEMYGQEFQVASDSNINTVSVLLSKSNSPTDNLQLKIFSGSFDGTLLGTSSTVDSSTLSTSPKYETFTFSTPVSLVASTTYYLQIERTGARDTTNRAAVRYILTTSPDDRYTGGEMYGRVSGVWNITAGGGQYADWQFVLGETVRLEVETPTGDPTINKSESVTVSESTSLLIPELNINKTDSITLTESVQRQVENYITETENITVTESVQRDTTNRVSVSDTSTLTEALQREVTNFIVETENTTVTDTPQVTILERFVNVSDTATLSESVSVTIQTDVFDVDITVSDNVTVTENLQREVTNIVHVSDTSTVTENVAIYQENYVINKSDSVTVTENVQRVVENRISVFDASVPTDSPTVSVQPTTTPTINVSDSTTLTENRTVLIPELLISKSENVTVTENRSLLIPDLNINKSENITVTESVNLLITELFIQETESVSITENVIVNSGNQAFYNVITSENVTVSEQVAIELSNVLLIESETVTVGESVSVSIQPTITPTISVSDTTTVTENAIIEPALVRINVSDTTTPSESTSVSVPTITWSINVSDSISGSASSRKYYIDSNGNVYWIVSESIGLVEKI